MTTAISSASPQALFHYADAAKQINELLGHEAEQLEAALTTFAASCTEFSSGISPQLVDPLYSHLQRVIPQDERVRQIGVAFQKADSTAHVGDIVTVTDSSLALQLEFEQFKNRIRNERRVDRVKYPRPDSLLGRLSPKEGDVSVGEAEMLEKLSLEQQLRMYQIYANAIATEKRFSKENTSNNGIPDAFRHAYWSALLTRRFGSEWAQRYTDAHETNKGNRAAQEFMDRSNNRQGIHIAQAHPGAPDEEIAQKVAQAIKDGRGIYIPGADKLDLNSQEYKRRTEYGPFASTNEQVDSHKTLPGTDSYPDEAYDGYTDS